MRTIATLLLTLASLLDACHEEKAVSGTMAGMVAECTENTLTLVDGKDTVTFDVRQCPREVLEEVSARDSVSMEYLLPLDNGFAVAIGISLE